MLKYFFRGRPFQHLSTHGLHLHVVGNSIGLLSGLGRQVWLGWPVGAFGWVMWLLPTLALGLLAMVVQASVREYVRRPDRPRRIWHINLNLEK